MVVAGTPKEIGGDLMKNRSTWGLVSLGAVLPALLLSVTGCGDGAGGGRSFLSIGTAGTGGIYYPLGGAIASRLSIGDPNRQYTAEVTGGSVENVNRVAQGEMDIGFSMATTVYEAFHGGAGFN